MTSPLPPAPGESLRSGAPPNIGRRRRPWRLYNGVIWRTGQVFDSSWARNAPFTTVIGGGQLIKGWEAGLVGQRVGSRVLLVIPPADGYGSSGSSQVGITGTDTMVFAVDILAAA